MKKTIALALVLALGTGFVHADEKKADAKKSDKAQAKKNDKKQHAAAKSDQNAFQKSESSIGHWARKNKIWGKARPGD